MALHSLNLVAILAAADTLALAASAVMGLPAALVAWWVLAALAADDLEQSDEWRYDISRINELRRLDVVFRLFQQPIQFLGKLNRAAFAAQLPEIRREIQAAGLPRYWLPEEYLGRMEWVALCLFP